MRCEPQTVPPVIKSAVRPSLAIFAGVVFGTAIAGAVAVVFFFNPSTNGFYPVCQFHRLTGLNCPGCGATRAFYALLHGNFSTALRDNALFVIGLVAAAGRGGWFALNWLRGRPNGAFFPGRLVLPLLV